MWGNTRFQFQKYRKNHTIGPDGQMFNSNHRNKLRHNISFLNDHHMQLLNFLLTKIQWITTLYTIKIYQRIVLERCLRGYCQTALFRITLSANGNKT